MKAHTPPDWDTNDLVKRMEHGFMKIDNDIIVVNMALKKKSKGERT